MDAAHRGVTALAEREQEAAPADESQVASPTDEVEASNVESQDSAELPPEVLSGPEDYPGVAGILDMPVSALAVTPSPLQDKGGKASKGDASKKGKEKVHTGIATKVALDRFVGAARDVQKNWARLNKLSRANKLGDAANHELQAAGVPKVGVVVKDLGGPNGQLDFTPWNLDLNAKPFEEAQAKYEALKAKKGTGAKETKAALAAWHAAYGRYKTAKTTFDATYAAYRALPEEADAWQVGDRVKAAYRGK